MRLQKLQIQNFRCFDRKVIDFAEPIVLIDGLNGSGKTSLLEALHYLCYLRSFRTHIPRDLLRFGQETFFLRVSFSDGSRDDGQSVDLQVGFSGKKRLVKINNKTVQSYKELIDHYRIVTLTEDDLALIQGSPEMRRSFVDLVLLMYEADFPMLARTIRTVVLNRNKLLQSPVPDKTVYGILTEQLWQVSAMIQRKRTEALAVLQEGTNQIIERYFDNAFEISFHYQSKMSKDTASLDSFLAANPDLYYSETRYRRSLFGAQLDDFLIKFKDKRSKTFASRGQQKLIILLLKIAQIKHLAQKRGSAIFLLDDFMTDFDENTAHILLRVLTELGHQIILTSPLRKGALHEKLLEMGAGVVSLTA